MDGQFSETFLNIFSLFDFSTIITIAHRLNTVLDYDRILVLKEGNVAEMDSPKQLMQTEGSIFRAMCQVRYFSSRLLLEFK